VLVGSHFSRAAVKPHRRLSSWIRENLDVPPAQAPNADTQRFGHRLFGREATSERFRSTPAVVNFGLGVNSMHKSFSPSFKSRLNALNLDYVDTRGNPYRSHRLA